MTTPEEQPENHTEDDLPLGQEAVVPFARRAPRISQADVFRAADELLVQGDRPTIDRVRMKLGRGSPNTINDHLDVRWTKLGARLRDLPGQEFPHLPKRVSQTLQQLWNEALAGAHEALRGALEARERALLDREAAIGTREQALAQQEQNAAARTHLLEDNLIRAREQLAAANQRMQALETTAQERDTECTRLRERLEVLDRACSEARQKLDTAIATHHAERIQLRERYAAAESHWQLEVDRARQDAKAVTKDPEHQLKELRQQVSMLQCERDELRQNLGEGRAEGQAKSLGHWRYSSTTRDQMKALSGPKALKSR